MDRKKTTTIKLNIWFDADDGSIHIASPDADFISTVNAPATPKSSAVTASPCLLVATTILPRRSRISSKLVVSARIAMISDAATITNSFSRGTPCTRPPSPITVRRSDRSFTSSVRGQVIV